MTAPSPPFPRQPEGHRKVLTPDQKFDQAQKRFRAQMKALNLGDVEKFSPDTPEEKKAERVESYIEEKAPDPKPWLPHKSLGPDDFCIYNGSRRQGKSWLTRFHAHAQRHCFRCAEVFTNTPMNGFWQKHFPQWKVITGWKPGTMLAIMSEQADMTVLHRKYPDRVNPYRMVILEDVANELTNDAVLMDLAAYGRHINISVHVITQHPQKLPPVVRSNADVVAIFPLHNRAALECLAADYLSCVPKDEAMRVLTEYAWKKPKQSQCLVIAMREGNRMSEKLFFCRAPDPGPFLIGCKEYWDGESTMPTEKEIAEWDREDAAASKAAEQ